MVRESLEQISAKTSARSELISDSIKLIVGIVLALATLIISVRGILLFISYIRGGYSWTYLILPFLFTLATITYFGRCTEE